MSCEIKAETCLETADPATAERLMPLLYDRLRSLARAKLRRERVDHTLQATALVHEAFLRLTSGARGDGRCWKGREEFFSAAAEAMRRILIDSVRTKKTQKRGGDARRIALDDIPLEFDARSDRLIAMDLALDRLETIDPIKANLVKLRVYSGLTQLEAAAAMGLKLRTADRHWAYARAWLLAELQVGAGSSVVAGTVASGKQSNSD